MKKIFNIILASLAWVIVRVVSCLGFILIPLGYLILAMFIAIFEMIGTIIEAIWRGAKKLFKN